MVEYGLLVAGTALRSLAADVSHYSDQINWTYVGYGAAILVMLRIAAWAFRPGPYR
jgi:hypothetical protein